MSTKATEIATRGFELADSGKLFEAVALYRQALSLADSKSDDLQQMHSEFASVLSRQGDFEAALEQRRMALDSALNEGGGPDSLTVAISRYFLGELLIEMSRPEEALAAIQPSLSPCPVESVLRMVEALAHDRLGHASDARAAARRAMECTQNEEQRARLEARLREILT
jgi:Flp pilus assembly protein TadD